MMEGQNNLETNYEEFRCKVCIKVFDRRSRLDSHMKTHTKERSFPCPFCEKNFSSKGNLNTHIRVHTKDRPYQCSHCNKRFSQNGQLIIHIRQHTGEKPFDCSECPKKFSCSKVLKIHMRTHTGEKPFLCEYCQKGFAAYANLVVHKRIHTGEQPYSCKLCGRRFEHSGNLGRHVRIHETENGNVRCIPCGQVFETSDLLIEHTLEEHPHEGDREEETIDKLSLVSNTESVLSTLALEDLQYSDTKEVSSHTGIEVISSVIDHTGESSQANCSMENPLKIRIHIPPKNMKLKKRIKRHTGSSKAKCKIVKSLESSDISSPTDEIIFGQKTYATINDVNMVWNSDTNNEGSGLLKIHNKAINCGIVNSELFTNIEMQCSLSNSQLTVPESFHHEHRHKRTPAPPPLIPIEKGGRTSIPVAVDGVITMASGNSVKCLNTEEEKRIKLKSQLETIRLNVDASIQRLLPISRGDSFKKKVEICLVALIGETTMKDFGFPKRTVEQVLIDILDMAEQNPCADVRVDEIERIKINFGNFVNYFMPNGALEELGWPTAIENIIDNIVFSLAQQSKSSTQDLNKWPQYSRPYKKETLTKNENKFV